MNERELTYWLQGYVEITNGQAPDATQWAIIRDHVEMVVAAQAKPEAPNTLLSPSRMKVLDTLCEGSICGTPTPLEAASAFHLLTGSFVGTQQVQGLCGCNAPVNLTSC